MSARAVGSRKLSPLQSVVWRRRGKENNRVTNRQKPHSSTPPYNSVFSFPFPFAAAF